MTSLGRITYVLVLMGCGTGCASMFVHGGRLTNGKEQSQVVAKYAIKGCVNTADGSAMQGPTAEYWLVDEPASVHKSRGLAVAEIDRAGNGTVITNAWMEPDGRHYFAWVGSNGWEYVIPTDTKKPGTRLVYVNVTTGDTPDRKTTKPTSAPSAKCVLWPAGVPAPSEPSASPAAPSASEPPPPAPSATGEPAPQPSGECFPKCRSGFVCTGGSCVPSGAK